MGGWMGCCAGAAPKVVAVLSRPAHLVLLESWPHPLPSSPCIVACPRLLGAPHAPLTASPQPSFHPAPSPACLAAGVNTCRTIIQQQFSRFSKYMSVFCGVGIPLAVVNAGLKYMQVRKGGWGLGGSLRRGQRQGWLRAALGVCVCGWVGGRVQSVW